MRGDGRVILDKRDERENPVYQARLRVPNAAGYNIVTTKTANLREAERIALNLYEELYMTVRAGGSIKSRTFKHVFEEWEKAATATATTRQTAALRTDGAVHQMVAEPTQCRHIGEPGGGI